MNKYDVIFEALQEKVNNGELTIEEAEKLNDVAYEKYVTESFGKSPLKDKLSKLKEIKDSKPGEFDDQKDIKKFVDENYRDIEKASNLLQEEPEKLTKDDRNYLITIVVSYCGYLGGLVMVSATPVVGVSIAAISVIWLIISSTVWSIIRGARTNADVQAMKDLSKVKTALKKLDSKKLNTEYKKKISKLIQSIDDAETDIYAKIKNVKESAYDEIAESIQESVNTGEMTFEEGTEMNFTAYDKIVVEASKSNNIVVSPTPGEALATAGIAIGIAASMNAIIKKIKKSKGYKNSPELDKLDKEIKEVTSKIKSKRSEASSVKRELQAKVSKYNELATYYASDKVEVDKIVYDYSINRRVVETVTVKNKEKDYHKAAEFDDAAKKVNESVKEYCKIIKELNDDLAKLKKLKKDLDKAAMKYKNDELKKSIISKVEPKKNEIVAKYESVEDEFLYMMESLEELNDNID